jgi:hypothetical protein
MVSVAIVLNWCSSCGILGGDSMIVQFSSVLTTVGFCQDEIVDEGNRQFIEMGEVE